MRFSICLTCKIYNRGFYNICIVNYMCIYSTPTLSRKLHTSRHPLQSLHNELIISGRVCTHLFTYHVKKKCKHPCVKGLSPRALSTKHSVNYITRVLHMHFYVSLCLSMCILLYNDIF